MTAMFQSLAYLYRNLGPYFAGVATTVSVLLFVSLYHGLLPVLRVKLELIETRGGLLHFRLSAENVSRVVAKLKMARVAFLEHDVSRATILSDWVQFDEKPGFVAFGARLRRFFSRLLGDSVPRPSRQERRQKEEDAMPYERRLVRPVMGSTDFIKPGQLVAVDLCYRPLAGFAVHACFQVQLKFTLTRILHRHHLSFATTTWALPTENDINPRDNRNNQKMST